MSLGWVPKFEDLRRRASEVLPLASFDHVDGGAADELTLQENRASWQRLKLIPHSYRRPLTATDISCTLLGQKLSAPLLIAPMSLHDLMHKDGECATAVAAETCGIPMCVSMSGSRDLEDISNSGTRPILFQQMYMVDHDPFMRSFLLEIYGLGCRCVVITVDSPVYIEKERIKNKDFPWDTVNYVFRKEKYWKQWFTSYTQLDYLMDNRQRLDWGIISTIKSIVDVKVLLKGILSSDDAVLAVENGADGIIVSNHGGRQLDTAVTAVDVLPRITASVQNRIPIIADGGIQTGEDILKALAMGASAVTIGRPVLFALAVGGSLEVTEVIEQLKEEFRQSLMLHGFATVDGITPNVLSSSVEPRDTSHPNSR